MQKYREELKLKKGWSQEKVIFHLNYLVSDFGSSYVRPIMWILLTLYESPRVHRRPVCLSQATLPDSFKLS